MGEEKTYTFPEKMNSNLLSVLLAIATGIVINIITAPISWLYQVVIVILWVDCCCFIGILFNTRVQIDRIKNDRINRQKEEVEEQNKNTNSGNHEEGNSIISTEYELWKLALSDVKPQYKSDRNFALVASTFAILFMLIVNGQDTVNRNKEKNHLESKLTSVDSSLNHLLKIINRQNELIDRSNHSIDSLRQEVLKQQQVHADSVGSPL